MNNNVTPVSFGANYLSEFVNQKTKERLSFVEYEHGFYDLVHLQKQTQNWNTKEGDKIFGNYWNSYKNGNVTKRFYGLENNDGDIVALCETKINDDKNDAEKYAVINVQSVAADPKAVKSKYDIKSLTSYFKREIKKQSDKCKDSISHMLSSRGKIISTGLDENGCIEVKVIEPDK